ncbi:MAG: FecR domain-containing protein [Chitinophagaceae bacterium]|nr:FecR domain-containing protein [Chitinophagaceae bacterium]
MRVPPHIQRLIQKYLEEKLSPDEEKQLDEWYLSFPDTEEDAIFRDEAEERPVSERVAAKIQDTLDSNRGGFNTGAPFFRKRFLIAAAVIAFVFFGGYRYFTHPSAGPKPVTNQGQSAEQEQRKIGLMPGGNKAVLTLSDGSSIILDNAEKGTLSHQGGSNVIKLDNGLVSYDGKSTTEGAALATTMNTISTPRGGQYQVILSDGSKVWLNAASSIHFPAQFSGKERPVSITGEVYFEVAPDSLHPFRVMAGDAEIEVLGTHFNVNTYDDEPVARTTLLEGSIKLSAGSKGKPTILIPGQQLDIDRKGNQRMRKSPDLEGAVAWMHGNFQFKSADIHAVLRQIARWYDAEIEYQGDVDLHFTGQLPRSQEVSSVLAKLMMTGEVQCKIEGRKITVSP